MPSIRARPWLLFGPCTTPVSFFDLPLRLSTGERQQSVEESRAASQPDPENRTELLYVSEEGGGGKSAGPYALPFWPPNKTI